MLVEYYLVERIRTTPRPRLVVDVLTSDPRLAPSGGTIVTPFAPQFFAGRFIVDFSTRAGRTYYVQYSSTANGIYTNSYPAVAGTGGLVRWTDTGPPRTGSMPTVGSRFYRVLEVP